MTDETKTDETGKRTWMDEIEVKSEELVNRVKQLAADNKVKRIRIIEPVLAILGALGAFAAKLKIEVVKEEVPATKDTTS